MDKICTKCGEIKYITEFSYKDNSKKYLKSHCKTCCNNNGKIYHKNNFEKISIKNKEYRKKEKNKISEQRKITSKKSYQKNRNNILKRSKKYYNDNPNVKIRQLENNRKNKAKKRSDPIYGPEFKLRQNVGRIISYYLKNNNVSKNNISIMNYLPYTIKELKNHIESLWESWMNWTNYGSISSIRKTWQIDHIIPQSLLPYDSMDHPNFKKCWALNNLRPLDALENIKKSNKIISYEVI